MYGSSNDKVLNRYHLYVIITKLNDEMTSTLIAEKNARKLIIGEMRNCESVSLSKPRELEITIRPFNS